MRLSSLALLLSLAACASEKPAPEAAPEVPSIPFRIDGTLDILRDDETVRSLEIEIADTDSTRARGMMQRTAFPEGTGMLFVFDHESFQSFWMGNTPLALDLVFISSDLRIASFAKYAVPFSNKSLNGMAQYVLEVPAGWVDTNGIVEGDRIEWTRR